MKKANRKCKALAEHAKVVDLPQLQDLQQKLREQSLANETENRQLRTLIQQLLDNKTETDKEDKGTKNKQPINYPPETILDSWAESAELSLKKTALNVKINIPDKQEEEYLQMRIKCEAYDIRCNGKQMPEGQILAGGRVIHAHKQRLQIILDTLRGNGECEGRRKKTEVVTKTGVSNDAVRGNKCSTQENKRQTWPTRQRADCDSPDSDGPNNNRRDGNGDTPNVLQLGAGGGGEPPEDDSDRPGSPGNPEPRDYNDRYIGGNGGEDRRGREFQLATPRNINIVQSTGKQLSSNPYMPFNNAIRNLILTQGQDGEELIEALDLVESSPGEKIISNYLDNLFKLRPKVYEYSREVKAASMNWIGGVAKGLVRHGVENGPDAWRKLYHKYVPLAEDLQNLLIQELMSFKTATESEVDSLFTDIERIRDLYIKAGTDEANLSDRWIRAAVLRNLFDSVLKLHAVELKKTDSIEEMQSVINTYQFDHKTRLPRGQQGPGLYAIEAGTSSEDKETTESNSAENGGSSANGDKITPQIIKQQKMATENYTLYINEQIKARDKKGSKKGYGECWHCGEWGHPRRECPKLAGGKVGGDVSALKGKNGY